MSSSLYVAYILFNYCHFLIGEMKEDELVFMLLLLG